MIRTYSYFQPALTRRQYLVGAAVTLAFFLLFYVTFGLLVLAERWPRWYNFVAPRAVLADPNSNYLLTQSDLRAGRCWECVSWFLTVTYLSTYLHIHT